MRRAALAGAGLVHGAAAQSAADCPTRAVKVIVPFSPAGPTDVVARVIAQQLSERLGKQFYVENVAHPAAIPAMAMAAKAPGDGYTVLVHGSNFIVNPSLYVKIPFDPYRDFTPVTLAGTMPNVIVTHPSVPAKTVKELIALVKANPGKYNYAHPSTGTTPHLAGELFKLTFGLDLLTVPFNGAGPAVQSLVGGDTPIGFLALLPVASNIKSGNLRCLVVLAKQRSETKDIKQRPVFGAVLPVRRPSEPAARPPAIAARIRRQHPSGGPDGALERPHLGAQLLQFPSTSWSRKERAGRRLPPSPGPKPQPESGVGGDGAQAVTGEDLPPASSFRVDLNQIRWCRCRRRVGGERRRFAYQRLRRYNP